MKKKVYLISPKKIDKDFYKILEKVLSFRNTAYFQLRLKNLKKSSIKKIAKKIKIITKKYGVKLIINDDYILAKSINADGCHIGQNDGLKSLARSKLKKKIMGVTCHNSRKLVIDALKNKADYIALGSFYKSRLKPNAKKANIKILKWANKNIRRPIVAIGGINNYNYKVLLRNGAKYIALSSYIWDNPKYKPEKAIKKIK